MYQLPIQERHFKRVQVPELKVGSAHEHPKPWVQGVMESIGKVEEVVVVVYEELMLVGRF